MQAGPDYAEGLINKMRTVIRRSPHQGDADHKTPETASLGQRLRSALPGSPHPKPSDSHSPPNGTGSCVLASSAGWANRRPFLLIIVALVAALAVSLSLWLPGGLLEARTAETSDTLTFAENGMGAVQSYTSMDPDGDSIQWSIRGLDAVDFTVSSTGVLEFKNPPNFEAPTDRALELEGDADFNGTDVDLDLDDDDTPATYPRTGDEYAAGDNTYQITVSATEMSGALPQKRTDLHLTVTVTNVDEPGTISFDALLPEVGTPVIATVTDPDNANPVPGATPIAVADQLADLTWVWYVSKVANPDLHTAEHWNLVPATDDAVSTTETNDFSQFTPRGDRIDPRSQFNQTKVDEGRYIRVRVDYKDQQGTIDNTAYGMLERPIRSEVSTERDDVPDLTSWDNGSPDFVKLSDDRTIDEDTAVGMAVGAAFQAVEPDPEDVLYYSLVERPSADAPNPYLGHDKYFDVDHATGQISVARGLDFEGEGAHPDDGVYGVRLMAKDPSGESDTIDVTIKTVDVDERPILHGRVELNVWEGIHEDVNFEGGRALRCDGCHGH